MKAWHNGEFVDWEKTNVSLLSHSFSRGSALFEVVDLLNTELGPTLIGLEEHVDRLYNSARLSMMDIPLSRDQLIGHIIATVKENQVKRGCIKFFVYYSDIELKVTPGNTDLAITIFAIDFEKKGIQQSDLSVPVDAKVSPFRKLHPETIPTQAKVTGAYLNPYLAKMEAIRDGYQEVILLDTMGYVSEGSTSNLFLVFEDRVVTPSLRSVLPGITRRAVIETFRSIDVQVIERDVLPRELQVCTEGFYTSSIVKIQPIRSIDRRPVGTACPGKITQALIDQMAQMFNGKLDLLRKWLTPVT